MKNAIIKYGICAANDDPWGVGRIRVIIDGDMIPPLKVGSDIEKLLAKYDSDNIKKNGASAYVPWELGVDYKIPDPYLFDPFLPKHLNLIPKVGESVKIIYYVLNDEVQQREYVCQHTSNYDSLNYDSGEHARSFTKLSTTYRQQNNYRNNGLVPDVNDVALIGRNNSDIVLPENEAFIRAGHQDFFNGRKQNDAALIQASYFNNRKDVVTESVTEDITRAVSIDNIVEYYVQKITPEDGRSYIYTELYVYTYPNLDNKNYNSTGDYFANQTANFLVTITGNSVNNTVTFIKSFLNNADKNTVSLNLSGNITSYPQNSTAIKYIVYDNRVSKNGEAINEDFNLGLYQFRPSPKNDYSVEDIRNLASSLPAQLRPSTKKPTRTLQTTKKDVAKDNPDFDETAIITGADKQFMLTWKHKNLANQLSKYGFSQEDINLILQKETNAMVRGDLLVSLLLRILDLILNHGHATGVDAIGSLNEGAVTEIKEIKKDFKLDNKVNKDLSGGSDILNQYLRLN